MPSIALTEKPGAPSSPPAALGTLELFYWRRVTVRSRAAMLLIYGALQMLVSNLDLANRATA